MEDNMLSLAEAEEASEASALSTRESEFFEADTASGGQWLNDPTQIAARKEGQRSDANKGRQKSHSLLSIGEEGGKEETGADGEDAEEQQPQVEADQAPLAAAQQTKGGANNRNSHAAKTSKKQPANPKRASDSNAAAAGAMRLEAELSEAPSADADAAGVGPTAGLAAMGGAEQALSWGADEETSATAGNAEKSTVSGVQTGAATTAAKQSKGGRSSVAGALAVAAKQGGKSSGSMPGGRQSVMGGGAVGTGAGRASVAGGAAGAAAGNGAGVGAAGGKGLADEESLRKGQEGVPTLALGQLQRRTGSPESQQQDTPPASSQRVKVG
jgi:hypothetical protein